MPSRMLRHITLKGYKSFRELDLELAPINVLIGGNGSGKSNFIGLFRLLQRMMNRELQLHVAQSGGAEQMLHYGRRQTQQIEIALWYQQSEKLANGYECKFTAAQDRLLITYEATYFHDQGRYAKPLQKQVDERPSEESRLPEWVKFGGVAAYVYAALKSYQVYHFHDTSEAARLKQMGDLHENQRLLPDAGNLAAYLYLLQEKYPQQYQNIIETIRLAAPFFGDFQLRPNPLNPEKIRLEWRERGSDLTFGANALSDGTLRFICLATLFLQPTENLPATIILDEPELGLHPFAIQLLAEMVHSVSQHTQVILATQSVTLLNQFLPEQILVLDRNTEGTSVISRLDPDQLAHWLEGYSLGELWEKNLLGGRPAR